MRPCLKECLGKLQTIRLKWALFNKALVSEAGQLDAESWRNTPCEHGNGEQNDGPASHGSWAPVFTSSLPLESSDRGGPANNLTLEFQTPGMAEEMSVILGQSSCGTF